MKAYIIQTGHFSQAGNFIGFSSLGERVHIYKKQINRLFPNKQVKHPFYCVADHLTFNSTYGTTFTRLTAEEISLNEYKIKEIVIKNFAPLDDKVLEQLIDFKPTDLKQDYDQMKELNSKIEKLENDNQELKLESHQRLMDLHCCKQDYDKLREEHEVLVAKVEHYDADGELNEYRITIDYLTNRIENLEGDSLYQENVINTLKWDNHFIQSERERLALIIINARESLASCNLGLSEEKIIQLINNA